MVWYLVVAPQESQPQQLPSGQNVLMDGSFCVAMFVGLREGCPWPAVASALFYLPVSHPGPGLEKIAGLEK